MGTYYLSLVLTPLRIRWTIPLREEGPIAYCLRIEAQQYGNQTVAFAVSVLNPDSSPLVLYIIPSLQIPLSLGPHAV
jgi:hypothetical protein